LAFALPLHKKIIVPIIFVLSILILSQFNKKQFLHNIKNKSLIFLLMGFYILGAISLLWTNNISHGLFDLEIKFSFIAFPILFFLLPFEISKKEINKIYTFFLIGTILGITICLINAIINYIDSGVFYTSFFYVRMSILHHPTYFSMYVNFYLVILFIKYKNKEFKNWLVLFLMVILILFNWLLLSRIGLGITALIIISFLMVLFFEKKYKNLLLFSFFILSTFVFAKQISQLSEFSTNRFKTINNKISDDNLNTINSSNNTSRSVTWGTAFKVIKDNPFFGVGIGDLHEEMNSVYFSKNYTLAIERNLNPHNQFLQTWVTIGIFGVLILISIFLVGVYYAKKNSNWYALGFFAITFISMLTESIIETQSGVIFFCFFSCLFFSVNNKSAISENQLN